MQILTKPTYWNNLPKSVQSYWQHKAKAMPNTIICTHRPHAKKFKGNQPVRRCSTGGRWGRSADIVNMSVESLLAAGYIFVN